MHRRCGLQAVAVGNMAFVTGVRYERLGAGFEANATEISNVTSVVISIASNATLPGGDEVGFWPGNLRVFVELLPMAPSNTEVRALTLADGLTFMHSVWGQALTQGQVADIIAGVAQAHATFCLQRLTF